MDPAYAHRGTVEPAKTPEMGSLGCVWAGWVCVYGQYLEADSGA